MENKKNVGRMKKRELLYRGCDYVKCFINEENNKNKNFKKLNILSVNSNQINIKYKNKILTITKIPNGGKYNLLFSINYESISVGFIGLYGGQSPDMIEITGQGLTIFGEDIFYFLFKYFGLTFVKFKRVDLCFDLNLNINYFYNRILDEKYKPKKNIEDAETRIKPWISKKNGLETLDVGEKNIKKNSYSFIRIYNKILDSKNKGKLFLYDDLYKKDDGTYNDVTRFEIEMREDLVKKFDFEYLKQYNFQFYRIVKSFYKMNVQFFKFLKDEDFEDFKKKYNKENKNIMEKIKQGIGIQTKTNSQDKIKKILNQKKMQEKYGSDFIDEADKQRTITMLNSYAGRLIKNGYTLEDINEIIKNKFDL